MLKLFTVKFEEKIESFNDTVLTDFLSDKKIIKWECNFFERKDSQYWTVLLEYEPVIPPDESIIDKTAKEKGDYYKDLLKKEDWPLFKKLREWRGEESKGAGVPPYVIFTNLVLAKIAVAKPKSLNALQQVEGVGNVKREKYGKDVVKIIKAFGKLNRTGKKESGNG